MNEEAVHVAFNSSDVRDINKTLKSPNPGPGTYININNPHHCAFKSSGNLVANDDRNFQEEQGVKLGPFGSNQERFYKSWLKPKDGPGPGQYTS